MTQYYQISGAGYPIISPIMLDGFTTYEVGKEPKVLMDAFVAQEQIEAQAKVNAEAKTYLASTDWYIVRQAETGIVVPPDVIAGRAEARTKIVGDN